MEKITLSIKKFDLGELLSASAFAKGDGWYIS
ncbi:Uncharacterised protein [Mycobacteroides abscessus subsp. abscessus]|nr:Uncharacterised protein [Mycobacteroides abscessus subsp. abscessus]